MRHRALLVLACLLAGCGGGTAHPAPLSPGGWTVFHDVGNRLTVRFPGSWYRAGVVLTPHLSDPHEILTLGTRPLRPGPRGSCAQMPVAAMRAVGARDVLLTIQERRDPDAAGFPARARPFDLGPADESEAGACVGSPRPWHSFLVSFRDAGRAFDLLALVGDRAPPARVRELHEIVDSLRFTPPRTFMLHQGVGGRLPGGWQLIHRRLTAVIEPRTQVAAATFTVPPGPPDSNCTPAAALRRIGPTDAFIYIFEYRYHAGRPGWLHRFPPRPAFFSLDRSTLQPYECMGRSYMLRFRDHGRGFQAHVYFGARAGPRRRSEALRFLDDLTITR